MVSNLNPLCYCSNVHPGRSLYEVEKGLDTYTGAIADAFGSPLAVGLWLSRPVVDELLCGADRTQRFSDRLADRGLSCHTLNAFPFGDFHGEHVKEQVYLPNWTDRRRAQYTIDCATVLAGLLSDGGEGSISTLPLGFKPLEQPEQQIACVAHLIDVCRYLDQIHSETGRLIRLAIEPEPFCCLETTEEVIEFFQSCLWRHAESRHALGSVERHVGVCFDVCHQAVEFEDVAHSITALHESGIRINKVHISCALELKSPRSNPEGRRLLARYAEPRYLHQTFGHQVSGDIIQSVDLTTELALHPTDAFLACDAWRIHFHMPVDVEHCGMLDTTRPELIKALKATAVLEYTPHWEVETYTWSVLPDQPAVDLVTGITNELLATQQLLALRS